MSVQLALDFVPRAVSDAANDQNFKDFSAKRPRRSTRLEKLIEEIQEEDRARLLEPTSLPKILRGHRRRRRPQTAIIALAAQRVYERRVAGEPTDAIAMRFFRAHERKIERIARKLGHA